jgi:hypothetical protein
MRTKDEKATNTWRLFSALARIFITGVTPVWWTVDGLKREEGRHAL